MFNMRRLAVGVAAIFGLLVALALPAAAAEETVTASIPFTPTDFGQPVSVPQFDPTLGELTQVDITAEVQIRGSIQVENTSDNPVEVTLNLVSVTSMTGPGFGPVEATATTEDAVASLEAFDGTQDFEGGSAQSFTGLTGSGSASVSLTDEGGDDITPYIGNGTVEFPISTNSQFGGVGPGGNLAAEFENEAAVELTVVYTFQAPAIDIEKATNGEDADEPPGPPVVIGDPITWTYVVTNTGDLELVDVTVTDDQGVEVSCPQATLAPGEAMTCTASSTAVEGQYANTGITVGTPNPPGPPDVTDDDPSHYQGVPPTTAPPTTAPPTTAPPPPPPTSVPPQLPETGSSSFPLAVVGTIVGLFGLWGLLAARKLAWSLLVDRDVDGLAKELPTWQDPARPR